MYVNDNEVKREIQKNPKTLTNVECYAGVKEQNAINGMVRNLKYNQSTNDFGKIKSFKIKLNHVQRRIWKGSFHNS